MNGILPKYYGSSAQPCLQAGNHLPHKKTRSRSRLEFLTLQIQGAGDDGVVKTANLGVSIEEPVALTGDACLGLLWWGLGFLVALLAILFVFFLLRRKRA
jgi:hypothetical protein